MLLSDSALRSPWPVSCPVIYSGEGMETTHVESAEPFDVTLRSCTQLQ